MAGDWIKMRTNLHECPQVVRIASALNADSRPHRQRVVGALHATWSLFGDHSEDGLLPGYTAETLDSLIEWPGWAVALESVGWLRITPDGLVVPDFDEHNGNSAKRRAMDSTRKRRVRILSACDADTLRTREEKRREEKREKKNPPTPRGGGRAGSEAQPTMSASLKAGECPDLGTPALLEAVGRWERELEADPRFRLPRGPQARRWLNLMARWQSEGVTAADLVWAVEKATEGGHQGCWGKLVDPRELPRAAGQNGRPSRENEADRKKRERIEANKRQIAAQIAAQIAEESASTKGDILR